MLIRAFAEPDTAAVINLWTESGLVRPWNDPAKDIARKLTEQPELFLVGVDAAARVMATAMIGFDGHRGWVYYLAVAAEQRGQGHARALMQEAETRLTALGCPKIMLMVRADNAPVIGMYEGLGYGVESTVVLGKRLIADD